MKHKLLMLPQLVVSIFITCVLGSLFFKGNVTTRIIMLPFLVCVIAIVGRSVCYMIDKLQYDGIFKKIYIVSFLVYWFGFLIYFDYVSLQEKHYGMLFFSIPFWIAGISIVCKFFFSRKAFQEEE